MNRGANNQLRTGDRPQRDREYFNFGGAGT